MDQEAVANHHIANYFDPQKFDIIQFDQRGCGQSTPYAELEDNNTQASVSDLESLREFFGHDKWHVFGVLGAQHCL